MLQENITVVFSRSQNNKANPMLGTMRQGLTNVVVIFLYWLVVWLHLQFWSSHLIRKS